MPLKHACLFGTWLAAASLLAAPAWAEGLPVPGGAQEISTRETPFGSYELPTGPAGVQGVPARRIEGRILRRTFRASGSATALQILAPMRRYLEEEGYALEFQCAARACGGFDFRFGIEVVPAPDMAVDVRNYQFLAATRGAQAVTLLVSRSGSAAYIQTIEVLPQGAAPLEAEAAPAGPAIGAPGGPASGEAPEDIAARLQSDGHAVLGDLEFATGSAELAAQDYASLSALAGFLRARPEARIHLVGHSDMVGGLEGNKTLSAARAAAVRARLVSAHGIGESRIAVDGVGFLAPVASNLTPEGREANRRVEAVLSAQ